jgi:hypothetical protein
MYAVLNPASRALESCSYRALKDYLMAFAAQPTCATSRSAMHIQVDFPSNIGSLCVLHHLEGVMCAAFDPVLVSGGVPVLESGWYIFSMRQWPSCIRCEAGEAHLLTSNADNNTASFAGVLQCMGATS